MTTMPEDLRTFVIGSTSVTGLISTRCSYNKDIPQPLPQPAVWFRVTNDNEDLTMDGAGGMHEADVDMECVATTETTSQAVADALKDRLHGYRGAMGNISCKGAFLQNKDDDYVPYNDDSDNGIHVVAYSLKLWYST